VKDALSTLLGYLPSFALRWIFSKHWLSQHTIFDVRPSNDPVTIFCGELPYLQLTLTVTNHTRLEVELDRLTVEFTFAGFTQQFYFLRRNSIPRRKTIDVFIRGNLTSQQAAAIAKQAESSIKVEVFAEFNSDIQDYSVTAAWHPMVKPKLGNI
jgi:hypothetical protein